MTTPKPFDLLHSPLEGTNLIEASAGTGKTYTIAVLFLRLILEKRLAVDEIAVVTFTVAATAELQERIRNALREALDACVGGTRVDPLFAGVVASCRDRGEARHLLDQALRAFDEAAIFTIHGFCQRVLREHAFESGTLFDIELMSSEEHVREEVVEDFWRTHFYDESPRFVEFVLKNAGGRNMFFDLAARYAGKPFLKVVPKAAPCEREQAERHYQEVLSRTTALWRSCRDDVRAMLRAEPSGLNRVQYPLHRIDRWVKALDECVASQGKTCPGDEVLEKLSASALAQGLKKNARPLQHPFFASCQALKEARSALYQAYGQHILGLQRSLFTYAQTELAARKRRRNLQSFDDLLLNVHHALEQAQGGELAEALAAHYHAAFIDEFQDTDPVQYAIFSRVFRAAQRTLFMIGDPKQAIYGFRGADVFAYLQAADHAETTYTLRENRRSHPALIRAINSLFCNAERPFVFEEISFAPAVAPPTSETEPLTLMGKAEPPMRIWVLEVEALAERLLYGKEKAIKKLEARRLLLRATAAEIARLLDLGRKGKALIGARPVREEDIAVLVRTNREGILMQQALSARGITSVLYSAENLFDSREALEMERVLKAIIEPANVKLVKVALVTDLFGIRGEELEALMEKEREWEVWLARFRDYHERWRTQSFVAMFRYLLVQEQVRSRLLSFPDGERRLTNLIHLSEVLHQSAVRRKLGMTGVLKWLSEQRNPDGPRLAEHQLRLESDEYAVKVVTIHKSKGLEYPIVFTPFHWQGSTLRGAVASCTFHDEERRLTLDLCPEEHGDHWARAEQEILAENLRLLYVAVTRAKHRVYLAWGRVRGAGSSALAYLLHPVREAGSTDPIGDMEARFKTLTDEQVQRALQDVASAAQGAIALEKVPRERPVKRLIPQEAQQELSCRSFLGSIDRTWRVSSFSSLVASEASEGRPHPAAAELPDHDAVVCEEARGAEGPADIFAFPRGAKAGTFMHEVFERLDFTDARGPRARELVSSTLAAYGFASTWEEAIVSMVQRVCEMPLDPLRPELTLSRIGLNARISELEFYFPVRLLTASALGQVFARHATKTPLAPCAEGLERLRFTPVQGYMKGFIDLVFCYRGRYFLADWKSNHLGSQVEDYGEDALAREMEHMHYSLQYHLYALALHRYLERRLPGYDYDEHFGGVYYVFVRGVDPQQGPGYGVFRDRPSAALIYELSDLMGAQETPC